MKLLIQKFGGTSVATKETRKAVYQKIMQAVDEGYSVVAVVSAMGRKGDPYATDTLLQLFSGGKELPNTREQEIIYCCGEMISGSVVCNELNELGVKSVFLTGGQAGILGSRSYTNAEILDVNPEAVMRWVKDGYVVLVAGCQAVTSAGDFVTIGRGGSDTTACLLGYYLNADEVRIYTDVDGVYTADPRMIKNAYPIEQIDYVTCRRMAEYGAKVIHPRAVAYSERGGKNVLSVRSTFTDKLGTNIGDYPVGCVGITGMRDKQCVVFPAEREAELQAALCEAGSESHLIAGNEKKAFCCAEQKYAPVLSRFGEGPGACDAVFAVGAASHEKFEELKRQDLPILDSLVTSEGDIAVFVRREDYVEMANKLHDSLCLPVD